MEHEKLSKLLGVPCYLYEDRFDIPHDTENYSILIDKNTKSGWLGFVYRLFMPFQLKFLISKLHRKGMNIEQVCCIYPNIYAPQVLFSSGKKAEGFCNQFILPQRDKSIKGVIKSALDLVIGFHADVSSFAFVVGKKNNTQVMQVLVENAQINYERDFTYIYTTNPVFLGFNQSVFPEYAIHNATVEDYEKKKVLYEYLGDLIAKPIHFQSNDSEGSLIEQGLKGVPWFQLLRNKDFNLQKIKSRALTTLLQFNYRVRKNPVWRVKVDVVKELNALVEQLKKKNVISGDVVSNIEKATHNFKSDQVLFESTYQHGDFCINNLVFAKSHTFVIDFEDFGRTYMPIQDEISLALSFFMQKDNLNINGLFEELDFCLKAVDTKLKEYLPLLIIYNLLFRLGEWGSNPNREKVCEWFKSVLKLYLTEINKLK